MERYLAAYTAETTKDLSRPGSFAYCYLITRRVEAFCFSASQRKAKKTKNFAIFAALR